MLGGQLPKVFLIRKESINASNFGTKVRVGLHGSVIDFAPHR